MLRCPDYLDAAWLFSMDPMRYSENGHEDDDRPHRSDSSRLECTLARYFESGQPGIACIFVYGTGTDNSNPQGQFWTFLDELAGCPEAETASY